ncbi:MFS transporter [Roseomonas sp. CECT 9278]|uniref:MFS transporter n=1 Tax=Roseomonas sp. CECT 9278 TaxID=2845823 RepID=UPI001E5525D9|nr:MFS transporter [Roseomonas sp. CECT 9278]CAH0304549.1 putative 3-phenylpropionic acid transporter [Roseomonas sp. CECT 9278]
MTSSAPRFAILFAAQFAAVGVMLPFIPPLMAAAGLGAAEVATILAIGGAVRLATGPLGGRIADALGQPRAVMAAGAAIAAGAAVLYGLAAGFSGLLAANLVFAVAIACVVPLGDSMALRAARADGWDYGRVRAVGSAAFIVAAGAAGWVAERAGAGSVAWLLAGALAAAAVAALLLPPGEAHPRRGGGAFRAVLALPAFRRVLVVSALIQGSHAAYYAFGSIHWAQSGVAPSVIGLLWAWSVVAEVALFAWGRPVADRLGARGLALVAAGAGVLRWAVTAQTAALPALVAAQALHALTFGAMHLATMRVMQARVPAAVAGTAQTLLAAGIGAVMMVATLAAGWGYAAVGGGVFWGMAGMCGAGGALLLRGWLAEAR